MTSQIFPNSPKSEFFDLEKFKINEENQRKQEQIDEISKLENQQKSLQKRLLFMKFLDQDRLDDVQNEKNQVKSCLCCPKIQDSLSL